MYLLKDNIFHYSQSHQNDPLGALIAKEVIQFIKKKNLIERSENIGNYLISELKSIKENFNIIKEVRGIGLMIAIEINDTQDNTFSSLIHKELLNRKIIIAKRPNLNVLRIDPPLTVGKRDIDYFLKQFRDVVSQVKI